MTRMNTIRDDDLILYHYRDGLDANRLAEIENALFASTDLRERYAAIEQALALADTLPTPVPDADFNARLWRQLEPRLFAKTRSIKRASWRDSLQALHAWLSPPHLAFAAACAIALAVGIGFYAGRQSAPAPALAQTGADAAAIRVLDAYVAAHLRATEGVLLTASNSESADLLDGNRQLAASLVEANRLYALAATRAGNAALADFLRQLEPVLISLANPSQSAPVQPSDGLRDYLRTTDLLFQVRAAQARLDRGGERRT
jgi:anti-sigma-K factor RskA